MTDYTWIAPTIVALATLIASVHNIFKIEKVHKLTNSNLQAVRNELKVANAHIAKLLVAAAKEKAKNETDKDV